MMMVLMQEETNEEIKARESNVSGSGREAVEEVFNLPTTNENNNKLRNNRRNCQKKCGETTTMSSHWSGKK